MTLLARTALMLALSCGLAHPAFAADQANAAVATQAEFDALRARIRKELADNPQVPSITVAVARDGKIVWEEGFGWADRETRRAATPDTPYSMASISKPITATGLMTLVRDGKLDLDRPANDYLGEAKLVARVGDARDATVRRVANHTAGLPLHYQFFYVDEPVRRPPMEETLRRYGNLVTAPGEIYEYSNLGYGVLDDIIARVSGQSYIDYMRTQVFEPLGMTHSSVDIAPQLQKIAATRYGFDGKPLPFYDFDHPGGSAVYASAHDLIRFAMFHLKNHLPDQKQILDDATIDAMHKPTASEGKGPDAGGYGVGFGFDLKGGHKVVSHTGSMGGVQTQMQLYPDANIAVVVLSNSGSRLPSKIADAIARQLLPNWPAEAAASNNSEPATPFAAPAALLGRWTGAVVTEAGDVPVELEFQADGDVHARFGKQLETLVNNPRFEDGRFFGQVVSRVDTEDTLRHPSTTRLSMTLRGNVLNGSASSVNWGTDLPQDPKTRNAVSHWIEVRKAP
ncbi:serine hydrolase domain-containing protein [Luteimonas sp. RIT-PG2_3]